MPAGACPDWREIARAKPSDEAPHRGWRLPLAADLEERRRAMRSAARARETRSRRRGRRPEG
jgi:hypothetical protein